jgi:hypothetical protein
MNISVVVLMVISYQYMIVHWLCVDFMGTRVHCFAKHFTVAITAVAS